MADGNGYMKAYHCILDDALVCLKPGEFSIFYFVYRKTIGWNKYVDRISYNQFVKETGLTRPTVFNNLESLEESKWIHVMREITKGGLPYNKYSLGEVVYKLNQFQSGKEIKPILQKVVKKLNQSKPKVVKKLNPQKIVPKDKKNNNKKHLLPNGMTSRELYKLIEFKPGMIKPDKQDHKDIIDFIKQQPKERIEIAVESVKEKNPSVYVALQWLYNELDQWEHYHPEPPKEFLPFATTEELNAAGIYAVNEAIKKEIEDDPDNVEIDF